MRALGGFTRSTTKSAFLRSLTKSARGTGKQKPKCTACPDAGATPSLNQPCDSRCHKRYQVTLSGFSGISPDLSPAPKADFNVLNGTYILQWMKAASFPQDQFGAFIRRKGANGIWVCFQLNMSNGNCGTRFNDEIQIFIHTCQEKPGGFLTFCMAEYVTDVCTQSCWRLTGSGTRLNENDWSNTTAVHIGTASITSLDYPCRPLDCYTGIDCYLAQNPPPNSVSAVQVNYSGLPKDYSECPRQGHPEDDCTCYTYGSFPPPYYPWHYYTNKFYGGTPPCLGDLYACSGPLNDCWRDTWLAPKVVCTPSGGFPCPTASYLSTCNCFRGQFSVAYNVYCDNFDHYVHAVSVYHDLCIWAADFYATWYAYDVYARYTYNKTPNAQGYFEFSKRSDINTLQWTIQAYEREDCNPNSVLGTWTYKLQGF